LLPSTLCKKNHWVGRGKEAACRGRPSRALPAPGTAAWVRWEAQSRGHQAAPGIAASHHLPPLLSTLSEPFAPSVNPCATGVADDGGQRKASPCPPDLPFPPALPGGRLQLRRGKGRPRPGSVTCKLKATRGGRLTASRRPPGRRPRPCAGRCAPAAGPSPGSAPRTTCTCTAARGRARCGAC